MTDRTITPGLIDLRAHVVEGFTRFGFRRTQREFVPESRRWSTIPDIIAERSIDFDGTLRVEAKRKNLIHADPLRITLRRCELQKAAALC